MAILFFCTLMYLLWLQSHVKTRNNCNQANFAAAITVSDDCSIHGSLRFYVLMALALKHNPFCKYFEPIKKHVFHNAVLRLYAAYNAASPSRLLP